MQNVNWNYIKTSEIGYITKLGDVKPFKICTAVTLSTESEQENFHHVTKLWSNAEYSFSISDCYANSETHVWVYYFSIILVTPDLNLSRTISLTSVVCKVLETILKEKIPAHLTQFSLLTSRQHGFLPDVQLWPTSSWQKNWQQNGSTKAVRSARPI